MTSQQQTMRPEFSDHPAAAGRMAAGHADESARRMAALVKRINWFLGIQLTKIERVCRHLEKESAHYAEWEQMSRDLREQQARWEERKADDAEKIAEQLSMLTAAWDGVEAERRSLMTNSGESPSFVPVPAAAEPAPELPPVHAPASNNNFFDFESTVTGRSAALQFQQIKREIRKHARRNPS